MKPVYSENKPRICVLVARFNELITKELLAGVMSELAESGVDADHVDVQWVPGSFELPAVASKAADQNYYAGIIALGCVIRGETAHFDYVAGPCASALMNVSVSAKIPVIFGVLTTDTIEQALNRVGLKHGHKGREAAQACLATIKTMNYFGNEGIALRKKGRG